MLNKETRKAIKSLLTIGDSAIIRYPYTSVMQLDKTLISFIDLEALGETEFEEFGVYFLSEFLSLVDLYEDGEITRDGRVIELKNSTSTQNYQTTELDVMKIFDMPSAILDKMLKSDVEVSFDLGSEQLDRIKKVASLLKLKSLIVDTHDDELNLVACNLSENNAYMQASTNVVPISEINSKVKIAYDLQNILKIPSIDFKVRIIQNKETKNYISIWEAVNDPIKIIVAVQKAI